MEPDDLGDTADNDWITMPDFDTGETRRIRFGKMIWCLYIICDSFVLWYLILELVSDYIPACCEARRDYFINKFPSTVRLA